MTLWKIKIKQILTPNFMDVVVMYVNDIMTVILVVINKFDTYNFNFFY